MKTIKIAGNDSEPIIIDLLRSDNPNVKDFLLIVGGSDDDRNTLRGVATNLRERGCKDNIVTISFRGLETNNPRPFKARSGELVEILNYLLNLHQSISINIICTSAGAIATTDLLTNERYAKYVKKAIYLDPADYKLVNGEYNTWNGIELYQPKKSLVAHKMSDISSDKIVHVVNFKIRNFGENGYAPFNQRGIDNPKLKSRLNDDMVKAFYDNTPEKYKGEYIENYQIPHAIVRDGDVSKNERCVAKLIFKLLNS